MSKNVLHALCGLVAACVVSGGPAAAAPIMPDFADVPTGWTTDRYEPHSFANAGTVEGRSNVLGIGISPDDGLDSRPSGYQSTFYNTQGRQHAVTGGIGSVLAADLYIPASWSSSVSGAVRTDMWGVMTDAAGAVTGYPIIGFTNYGETARLRVWDENPEGVGTWMDLGNTITFDSWTSLAISFTGLTLEYYVNGVLAHIDSTLFGATGFSAVIMQAYNFDDPAIEGAVVAPYVAYWSNTAAVPEPAAIVLLGFGLLCIAFLRRRPRRA